MEWASVISREFDTNDALDDVVRSLRQKLEVEPDLLVVFSSRHHTTSTQRIPAILSAAFGRARVVGCAAYSVVGGSEEEEDEPALSVTAASLPGVEIDLKRVDTSADAAWLDEIPGEEATAMMLVVDAFSTDADQLIRKLDQRFPDVTKFGGFASGGVYPGSNALFLDGQTIRQGSVVVTFSGPLHVDTIVAQGCRPIGEPMRVRRHHNNMILELDQGRPADVLQQLYERLPVGDRALVPDSLHLGIEMRTRPDGTYHKGDFLVRPLVSIDPNSGAVTIGGRLRGDEVVQFHLRDAAASTEDLREWLEQYPDADDDSIAGALLFSCVARGVDLFGEPNHDTGLFRSFFGDVPVGGFFCSREIGPINEQTFIHGYTSTFAIFREGG